MITRNSILVLATAFIILSFFAQSVLAQQKAKTGEEGGTVYAQPSFDGEVLGEIPPLSDIVISQKKVEGIFHRIRFEKKIGYLSDHQVLLSTGKKTRSKPVAKKTKQKMQDLSTAGVFFGQLSFVDEFESDERKANLSVVGFDITGPEGLVSGIPLSTKVIFSSQSPNYYVSGSGSLLLVSLSVLSDKPLTEDISFKYGMGLLLRSSSFTYKEGSVAQTIKRSNLGLTFPIGLAARLGSFVLRPEAQYFYEKKSYWSIGLNLSYVFRD